MNPAVLSSTDTFVITFMASLLIWMMFAGLMVLWLIDGKGNKEQVIHAVFSVIVSFVVVWVVKSIFPTFRPFHTNGQIPLTLTMHWDSSFPSTHAAIAFSLAASIWLHDRKNGYFFVICAFLVTVGRVLGSVHYLIDVIIGGFIGVMSARLLDSVRFFKKTK